MPQIKKEKGVYVISPTAWEQLGPALAGGINEFVQKFEERKADQRKILEVLAKMNPEEAQAFVNSMPPHVKKYFGIDQAWTPRERTAEEKAALGIAESQQKLYSTMAEVETAEKPGKIQAAINKQALAEHYATLIKNPNPLIRNIGLLEGNLQKATELTLGTERAADLWAGILQGTPGTPEYREKQAADAMKDTVLKYNVRSAEEMEAISKATKAWAAGDIDGMTKVMKGPHFPATMAVSQLMQDQREAQRLRDQTNAMLGMQRMEMANSFMKDYGIAMDEGLALYDKIVKGEKVEGKLKEIVDSVSTRVEAQRKAALDLAQSQLKQQQLTELIKLYSTLSDQSKSKIASLSGSAVFHLNQLDPALNAAIIGLGPAFGVDLSKPTPQAEGTLSLIWNWLKNTSYAGYQGAKAIGRDTGAAAATTAVGKALAVAGRSILTPFQVVDETVTQAIEQRTGMPASSRTAPAAPSKAPLTDVEKKAVTDYVKYIAEVTRDLPTKPTGIMESMQKLKEAVDKEDWETVRRIMQGIAVPR